MEIWGYCDECRGWFACRNWFDPGSPHPVCPRCGDEPTAIENRAVLDARSALELSSRGEGVGMLVGLALHLLHESDEEEAPRVLVRAAHGDGSQLRRAARRLGGGPQALIEQYRRARALLEEAAALTATLEHSSA